MFEARQADGKRPGWSAMTPSGVSATPPAPRAPAGGTIGIVIPHYCDLDRLHLQLAALAAQIRPPDAILVVDDGSPAAVASQVEAALSGLPGTRFVRLSSNVGPAAASVAGLDLIDTDLVAFLACGDEVAHDFLAETGALLASHPRAAFCFADPRIADAKTGKDEVFGLALSEEGTCFTPDEVRHIFRTNYFTFTTNTILYRTGPVRAVGGFLPELGSYSDSFANYVLAFRHGCAYVPQALGTVRETEASFSVRERADPGAMARIARQSVKILRERFPDVFDDMRRAGCVPQHSVGVLLALASDPATRGYLTARLVVACLALPAWHAIRPAMPAALRRGLRFALSWFGPKRS
ncbi:glycosyltransferase family A protein [Phreatobacter sp. HK31-P]